MNNPIEPQFRKSGIERRILAFVIDHFVITFLIVATIFLMLGSNFSEESIFDRMASVVLWVMLPGMLLYIAKDILKGISIGKWIVGIMVRKVNNHNETPSIGSLLLRNILIIIWPVEFIALLANQDKRRLGDKIAKTDVVDNPNKPKKLPRILALVVLGLIFLSFLILITGSVIKNTDAYKVAVTEIEKNEEILLETGGIKGYGMLPRGSVSIKNGFGQANLSIKVLGNDKDLNVGVYLTKEPDQEWKFIRMNR